MKLLDKGLKISDKKKNRRVTAWLLVFAMTCALLSFSESMVQAQNSDVEVILQQGQGKQNAEVPADKSSVDR